MVGLNKSKLEIITEKIKELGFNIIENNTGKYYLIKNKYTTMAFITKDMSRMILTSPNYQDKLESIITEIYK